MIPAAGAPGWSEPGWKTVQRIVAKSEYDYSDEFLHWLHDNHAVWVGFSNKATQAFNMREKHRFGAKAILEILRWETAIQDADSTFKINNNYAPDLARLVMDCKPSMKGFFSIRGSANRSDAAP